MAAQRVAVALASGMPLFATHATPASAANDFNAEKVLKQMTPEQQSAYLAGVIEGLAVARYMKDGKEKTGMECIYDWFYEDKQTLPGLPPEKRPSVK